MSYYEKNRERIRLAAKHRRRTNVAAAILVDAKKADKKRGRQNDLSLDFVEGAVASGCAYCGETELRMTLDRIDNTLGHTKANTVPACERCNYIRRDMPYAAWYFLLPAIRAAREAGLFGDWTCSIHRRRALPPVPPIPERPDAPHGTIARYHYCGPPRCELCKEAMRDWKRMRRDAVRMVFEVEK